MQAAGQPTFSHLISYGQSLSVGVGTSSVVSTTPSLTHKRFSSGVRTQDAGVNPYDKYASVSALVETVGPAGATGGQGFETPIYGASSILEELGFGGAIFGSAPGQGSATISYLSKGAPLYGMLIDDVKRASYAARRSGSSHKCFAIAWMQGESDGGNSAYASNLNDLRTSLDADIRAITRQPESVWILSYQLDRPFIGLAQLSASDTYENIKVAMPMYHIEHSDGTHLTAAGSKIAGAYFGKCYKEVIVDGNTGWQPLRPVSSSVAGAVCDVVFNPVGSLAFDTTIVAAQTNYGFKLFQSDGTTPITISSVSIVGSNTVRITASGSIPAGAILRYGFSDPTDHTANVAKGNLRDSQGNSLVFDGGGLNYPMHNWCVLFQRPIS